MADDAIGTENHHPTIGRQQAKRTSQGALRIDLDGDTEYLNTGCAKFRHQPDAGFYPKCDEVKRPAQGCRKTERIPVTLERHAREDCQPHCQYTRQGEDDQRSARRIL